MTLRFAFFLFGWMMLCLLPAGEANAQASDKYWIFLKDKPVEGYDYRQHLSPAAIEKRQLQGIPLEQHTDIPLDDRYLKALRDGDVRPVCLSKWLNAASAHLTDEQVQWVKALPFVARVQRIDGAPLLPQAEASPYDAEYATAVAQMEPKAFEAAGLTAKGIIIGVIDGGFFGATENKALRHIFEQNRVLGVRDYINPKKEEHFNSPETFSDWHGTKVMQMIAGKRPDGPQYGFALEASFYLARTEDGNHEFRGEEDFWINAMEWMDSLGVRIINTSLGYATNFDNPKENYTVEQMDGRTAVITKAAQIAVEEKGLLLVVSAGNEGQQAWRIVSAPADAAGVVSVGATNANGTKAGYSSVGPAALPYLKPDVSCHSLDGTSFSAPVVTGFAACLMQLRPDAKGSEIADALRQSAPLYPYGNHYIGYGIPQASRAINLLGGKKVSATMQEKKGRAKEKIQLKHPMGEGQALLFHKTDGRLVEKEQVVKASKGKIQIKRPKQATRTTVLFDNNTGVEIIWE